MRGGVGAAGYEAAEFANRDVFRYLADVGLELLLGAGKFRRVDAKLNGVVLVCFGVS